MTAQKKEHEERIADARNGLADVINKARYLQEPTFLTNRGKRVAVVVSTDFYEQSRQRAAAIAELRAVFLERPDIAEALEGHADDLYEHITSGAI